jgi:excisionase family DNA binding protein
MIDATATRGLRTTATDEEQDMTELRDTDGEMLLTPGEVAQIFRVNPKTVSRWARAGKISTIRTLGGHRRFRAGDVEALVAATEETSVLG